MRRLRDKIVVLNAPPLGDPYNPSVDTSALTSTRDWTQAVAVTERAEMRPVTSLSSGETLVNEDTLASRWRVLLSPHTAATYASRIRWRGIEFEVDGDVQPQPDHMTRIIYTFAYLRRAGG